MAEIFNFYVQDNRSIQFPKANLLEPIMQEDHNVAVWRFRIPKVLNGIDMSGWAWWFVYVNARGQEFSELLTLVDDIDEPDSFCTADYSIDYGISYHPGNFQFSLEAINADSGGEVLNEWHTKTYAHKVDKTLQGNQAQWSETESDIISALIVEVQNKVSQLVGGATPEPKNLVADMKDPKKVYLYVGNEENESNGYWYYHNGTRFVPGGLYASGITVDAVPTQGSSNAVSSGGVYDALQSAGLSEDAKVALLACFQHVAWIDEHGQDYYNALESALYPETGLVRIEATFTQGSAVVTEGDDVNTLKAYLVVTGYYNDGTSKTETYYSLSGTLTAGTSIITVSKEGKTTTFNVTVTALPAIKLFVGKGTSGASLIDNDKRILSEPIAFSNTPPITIQLDGIDGYRYAIKNMLTATTVDTDSTLQYFPSEYDYGTEKDASGSMFHGWMKTDDLQTVGKKVSSSAQTWSAESYQNTSGYLRVLIANRDSLSYDLPSTMPSGFITIQGTKYKIEVEDKDEFI